MHETVYCESGGDFGERLLGCMMMIKRTGFPQILLSILESRGRDRGELYDYLIDHGFEIEKTSMYKYFNSNPKVNRLPERRFLRLFAAFLQLSSFEEEALHELWQYKRRRQRKARKAQQQIRESA